MSKSEEKETVRPPLNIKDPVENETVGVQNANVTLLTMFDRLLISLDKATATGTVNTFLGAMGFMTLIDILHGGAYACPNILLPYYRTDPEKSPYFNGATHKTPSVDEGLLGWLTDQILFKSANEMAKEVLMDSNAPHVFPKLISDQMYIDLRAFFIWNSSLDSFKSGVTGLQTLVNAETDFVKGNIAAAKEVTSMIPKAVVPTTAMVATQ